MLIMRIQPPKFRTIKPFLYIIAGWNIFFSTVTVERLTYYSDYNSSYSNSTKRYWAFAYGATDGLDISINKRDALGPELKVAYLAGSYTTYLTILILMEMEMFHL